MRGGGGPPLILNYCVHTVHNVDLTCSSPAASTACCVFVCGDLFLSPIHSLISNSPSLCVLPYRQIGHRFQQKNYDLGLLPLFSESARTQFGHRLWHPPWLFRGSLMLSLPTPSLNTSVPDSLSFGNSTILDEPDYLRQERAFLSAACSFLDDTPFSLFSFFVFFFEFVATRKSLILLGRTSWMP